MCFCRSLKPSMMQRLLRKLIMDVPALAEHTFVSLKVKYFDFINIFICIFVWIVEKSAHSKFVTKTVDFPNVKCLFQHSSLYKYYNIIHDEYQSLWQILMLHYERCVTYYGSLGGWGTYGSASDEEKRLTMLLFTGLFDALADRVRTFTILYFISIWC